MIEIPDLTKLSWPLNVALVGAVFSVFALIYNPYFIYYGFITFGYGVICHLVDMVYSFWLSKEKWETKFVVIAQSVLTLLWIGIVLAIYK